MRAARFYIQRPADEYGNTGYPLAVIEATAEDLDSPFGARLHVVAPASFGATWHTVRTGYGWVETEGPARMLSREEWEGIIETLDILANPDAMAAIEEAES